MIYYTQIFLSFNHQPNSLIISLKKYWIWYILIELKTGGLNEEVRFINIY